MEGGIVTSDAIVHGAVGVLTFPAHCVLHGDVREERRGGLDGAERLHERCCVVAARTATPGAPLVSATRPPFGDSGAGDRRASRERSAPRTPSSGETRQAGHKGRGVDVVIQECRVARRVIQKVFASRTSQTARCAKVRDEGLEQASTACWMKVSFSS